MIVAIDPATTTGWACGVVGSNPPQLKFGTRNFGGSDVPRGIVFSQFRYWLVSGCMKLKPSLIVFETPYVPRHSVGPQRPGIPMMNPDTLRRLLWFAGEIEAVAAELGIECREVTPAAVGKFFTGKARWPGGRIEKKRRTMDMCRAYGWEVTNDNEADALAMWAMAEAVVSPRAASARGDGALFIPREILSVDIPVVTPSKTAEQAELL